MNGCCSWNPNSEKTPLFPLNIGISVDEGGSESVEASDIGGVNEFLRLCVCFDESIPLFDAGFCFSWLDNKLLLLPVLKSIVSVFGATEFAESHAGIWHVDRDLGLLIYKVNSIIYYTYNRLY